MRFFPLLLLAGLVLAVSGCTKSTPTGVFVDPAFGPLIPPDTTTLAGIRIDKLKSTALYKRYQNRLDLPVLNQLSEKTGLDPRRDLWDVVLASNGKTSLVLARGKFTVGELEPKLGALGARRTSYKNHTLLGDERYAAVFINPGVAVEGPESALRAVIDRQDDRDSGVPEPLKKHLALLPQSNQIWAVSQAGLPLIGVPMRSEIDSALQNIVAYISSTAIGVGVDDGVHLRATVNCISDEGAQRVRDALRGGIGFARLSTKDDAIDMLRLYDSIQVSQEKLVVQVNADLSASLTDKLIARLPALEGAAKGVLQR